MKYEVVGRGKKAAFLRSIMESLVDQLKLNSSTSSVVITLQPDCDDDGITVPLKNTDVYFVVLNSRCDATALGVTLAHEMVHVAQMARGTLRGAPRGGHYWSGKLYGRHTQYLDRPWELQAFAKQEILFRRALLV